MAPLIAVYLWPPGPRPFGVTAIGDWEGYSSPSQPIAALTAILVGIA